MCNVQTGTTNFIITADMTPDPSISVTIVSTITTNIFFHGSIAHPGTLTINISSLPTLGSLSQMDFYNPQNITPITHPNTAVTDALSGIKYILNLAGTDSFQFVVMHGGVAPPPVTVLCSVIAWNYQPIIPHTIQTTVLNRNPILFDLQVHDPTQKQFLGINITSCPQKARCTNATRMVLWAPPSQAHISNRLQ